MRQARYLRRVNTRTATAEDREAIRALAEILAFSSPLDPAAFGPQFEAALADDHTDLLVAVDEGIVVGYLLGVVCPMFVYNGPFGFVQELCVAAEHRTRGIGTELMAEFTRRATARGVRVVALATSRAGPFYEVLGYESSATYFKKVVDTESVIG